MYKNGLNLKLAYSGRENGKKTGVMYTWIVKGRARLLKKLTLPLDINFYEV